MKKKTDLSLRVYVSTHESIIFLVESTKSQMDRKKLRLFIAKQELVFLGF